MKMMYRSSFRAYIFAARCNLEEEEEVRISSFRAYIFAARCNLEEEEEKSFP